MKSSAPSPLRRVIESGYLRLVSSQMMSSGAEFFLESLAIVAVAVVFVGPAASLGLAALTLISVLPRIALSGSAGVVADSRSRSGVMRASLFVRLISASLLLLLSVLTATDSIGFSIAILSTALITACAAQYFNMSRTSLAQTVIPEDARPEAAAMSMFALTGIGAIASAIGPLVYSAFGPKYSVLLVLALEVGALVACLGIHDRLRSSARAVSRGSIHRGFWLRLPQHAKERTRPTRIAFRSLERPVKVVFLAAITYAAGTGAINQALPLYVMRTRDIPVSAYGLISGAFAVGGICGAILSARIIRAVGSHNTLRAAGIVAGLLYFGFALSGEVWLLIATMLGIGFTVTVFGSSQGPILQDNVQNDQMGRVYGKLTRVNAVALILGLGAGLALCVGLPVLLDTTYESMYTLTLALGGLNLFAACFVLTLLRRRAR